MKTIANIAILVLIYLFANTCSGQGTTKYRITAVNKMDNSTISTSNSTEAKFPTSIYVPSAFTPNQDGLNDTFGAVGEGIEDYSMQIYNRLGQLVFESDNVNLKWDGTFQNQPVSTDVYVYNVVARTHNGNQISKAGSVTVITN